MNRVDGFVPFNISLLVSHSHGSNNIVQFIQQYLMRIARCVRFCSEISRPGVGSLTVLHCRSTGSSSLALSGHLQQSLRQYVQSSYRRAHVSRHMDYGTFNPIAPPQNTNFGLGGRQILAIRQRNPRKADHFRRSERIFVMSPLSPILMLYHERTRSFLLPK
jgi:hypothetical protein